MPEAGGLELLADGKAVGELTSVAQLPGGLLGLGYVRRDAAERGGELRYAGGLARSAPLPFRDAAALLTGGTDALRVHAASEG